MGQIDLKSPRRDVQKFKFNYANVAVTFAKMMSRRRFVAIARGWRESCASSEEGKQALSMLTKPLGTVLSLVLRLIVVVPGAVFVR